MSETPTVLVVDDDRPIADGFTAHLSPEFEVRTAYTGEQALDRLDDSVDVVLLDRGLPDTSGDAVLETIRASDLDCRVAMVSGEEPSPDLDCDVYLTKPLSEIAILSDTVTELADGSETSR